jgi:uncharacterized protein with NRDE domain
VCLLVVFHRVHPAFPLVVAANRDELLSRPSVAMTVLRDEPKVLGGRDAVANGTWLAANEHGLVAGLSNLPNGARDSSKRSRGELPLALAVHTSAARAVDDFRHRFRPSDFNPAWIVVGDRESLFYVDMTGTEVDAAVVEELGPGVHVLENAPLHAASIKADFVKERMEPALAKDGAALREHLAAVLGSHEVPAGAVDGPVRPASTYAACVHAGPYGTRSSSIVLVPPQERPQVFFADGSPCTTAFTEAPGW